MTQATPTSGPTPAPPPAAVPQKTPAANFPPETQLPVPEYTGTTPFILILTEETDTVFRGIGATFKLKWTEIAQG